jgi:FMN phosphatase YigB (HAD superfamily)
MGAVQLGGHLVHVALAGVDALLYDFGGVMVEIHFDRVIRHWARAAGTEYEALRTRFAFSPAYEAHERGEIDAAQYFQALRGELGIAIDDAEFAAGWNEIFGDEIAPTVEAAHRLESRVPQYLFSNTNAMHHAGWSARYARALSPLRRHFVSYEMRLRKPDRAAFEHIAREIGVAPRSILFFDDTAANVEGARAAGLEAVLVRSPEDVVQALRPWLEETPTRT